MSMTKEEVFIVMGWLDIFLKEDSYEAAIVALNMLRNYAKENTDK